MRSRGGFGIWMRIEKEGGRRMSGVGDVLLFSFVDVDVDVDVERE